MTSSFYLRIGFARLVTGRDLEGCGVVIVEVAEGVGDRKDNGERKNGGRVEVRVDDVGIVDDSVAVADAFVVAVAEVNGVEFWRGDGVRDVGGGVVGVAGDGFAVAVVVEGGVAVDDNVGNVIVVLVVGGSVEVEDVIVVLVANGGAAVVFGGVLIVVEIRVFGVRMRGWHGGQYVGEGWSEVAGDARDDGGDEVAAVVLHVKAAIEARSDALSERVIAFE